MGQLILIIHSGWLIQFHEAKCKTLDKDENTFGTSKSSEAEGDEYLCIEMEFCDQGTLRDEIESRELFKDREKAWKCSLQILEALTYIHQQGISHRDLKPENVLIDSSLELKLADFGLAKKKVGDPAILTTPAKFLRSQSIETTTSMTANIGTSRYRAPEIIGCERVPFSSKIDIYAFGVLFFELFHQPTKTMAEMQKIFNDLKNDGVFPDKFENGTDDFNDVRYTIFLCLQKDPSFRPTAQELLNNIIPFTPFPLTELEMKQIVKKNRRAISKLLLSTQHNPKNELFHAVDCACFKKQNPTVEQYINHVHTHHTETPKNVQIKLQVVEYIKSVVTKVLRKFGTVNIDLPSVAPKVKFLNNFEENQVVIDNNGRLYSLPLKSVPNELSKFLCHTNGKGGGIRLCSFQTLCNDSNYCCIQDEIECSYYIITPTHTNNYLHEAEAITAVLDVVACFPTIASEVKVFISHTGILQMLFKSFGLTETLAAKLYKLFDNAVDEKQVIAGIENLSTVLSPNCISVLKDLLQLVVELSSSTNCNAVSQFLSTLREYVQTKSFEKALKKFLKLVFSLNDNATVFLRTFVFAPISCFDGLCFKILLPQTTDEKEKTIASGGYYGKRVWKELSSCNLSEVVGFKVDVTLLSRILMNKIGATPGSLQLCASCDVIVWGNDKDKAALVLKSLWDNCIRAKIYDSNTKVPLLAMYMKCNEECILLGVEVKADDLILHRMVDPKGKTKGKSIVKAFSDKDFVHIIKELLDSLKTETIHSSVSSTVPKIESQDDVTFLAPIPLTSAEMQVQRSRVLALVKQFPTVHICAVSLNDDEMAIFGQMRFNADDFEDSFSDVGDQFSNDRLPYLVEVCSFLRDACVKLKKIIILFSYMTGGLRVIKGTDKHSK